MREDECSSGAPRALAQRPQTVSRGPVLGGDLGPDRPIVHHGGVPGASNTPVEPSDEVYRVYGSVMHTVQYWELALAVLWWQVTTPEADRREAESKASRKAVDRLEKAFTKMTASQARKELENDLPPETLGLVGGLLEARNQLAHRFLRERQDADGFKP